MRKGQEVHHDETIFLPDLVRPSEEEINQEGATKLRILDGFDFIRCTLVGPTMLYVLSVAFEGETRYSHEPTQFLWIASPAKVAAAPLLVGVVVCNRVLFRDCRFRLVGFMGSEDTISELNLEVFPPEG